MEEVAQSFKCGKTARSKGHLKDAIRHFSNALKALHTLGHNHDPFLCSNILLARAEVLLRVEHYNKAMQDIQHALNCYPQQINNLAEAEKWFDHARDVHPTVSVCCYSVALRFSAENKSFQSYVYGRRALAYSELEAETKCDNDIMQCREYDLEAAIHQGGELMSEGIFMHNLMYYTRALSALQLAEKFLQPLTTGHRLNPFLKQRSYECCKYIVEAAWGENLYFMAIHVGKRCRQMYCENHDEKEAVSWKEKGNAIIKEGHYAWAIDCYTLSIQYAPAGDIILLGTLHSNRSHAYLKEKEFLKAKQDAEKCLRYRPDWSKTFYRLGSALLALREYDRALDILCQGISIEQVGEGKYDLFQKVMILVLTCKDGPTRISFTPPREHMSRYLKECVEKQEWRTLETLFLGGGGKWCYLKGEGGIATGNCDLKEISLCDVITSKNKFNKFHKMITTLIGHGALVNGRQKSENPLCLAVNNNDYELVNILLENKAETKGLLQSKYGKSDDVIVHTAFRIGLITGHWTIFKYLVDDEFRKTGTFIRQATDKKGNSLFHLVASKKQVWSHVTEGANLLKMYKIDPTAKNNDGKTPLMMLHHKKDPRYCLIEEVIKSFASSTACPTECETVMMKNTVEKSGVKNVQSNCHIDKNENHLGAKNMENVDVLREKISHSIDCLYTVNENRTEKEGAKCTGLRKTIKTDESNNLDFTTSTNNSRLLTFASQNEAVATDKKPLSVSTTFNPLSEDVEELNCAQEVSFDNLIWEVECTSEVLKKLTEKKLPRDFEKRIMDIIRELASGNMRGHLAKPLEGISRQNRIHLFEAKLSKSARILWERTIAVSRRKNNGLQVFGGDKKEKEIFYTEIIRVWDIVFGHDTVPRKIEKIVHAHKRYASSFIKKQFKVISNDSSSLKTSNNHLSIPNIYVVREDSDKELVKDGLSMKEDACDTDETSTIPSGGVEETEFYEFPQYRVQEQTGKPADQSSAASKQVEYMKAADFYLQYYMNDEAAECLQNAQELALLAKLYEKSGSYIKAAELLQQEGNLCDASRNFESAGDFESAVDCLLEAKRYDEVLEVMARYLAVIQKGQEHSVSNHPRFGKRGKLTSPGASGSQTDNCGSGSLVEHGNNE